MRKENHEKAYYSHIKDPKDNDISNIQPRNDGINQNPYQLMIESNIL